MTTVLSIKQISRNILNLTTHTLICVFVWGILFFLVKILVYKPIQGADYSLSNFKVLGLNLPRNLEFCGERIPQNDYEIKESLEKEFHSNKHWKSSAAMFFSRAQKWFPVIEPILKREGVPDDFKYVAVIESHLSNALSPMGAAGFWQLVPNTAQNYGLEVGPEVDERYDVEKSTVAACKHFKDAYQVLHNWTLSAAAYNLGIGGIQKRLAEQHTDNYYDLLLNAETGSFVYRILAYKTLLSDPQHFGLKQDPQKKSGGLPPYKILRVDSSITNLHAFARHAGTNIITLRVFNAWLIGDKLTNPDHKTYNIRIPKNKNVDLSNYFTDVFPEEGTSDTLVTMIADTLKKNITDTLKKQ
ncbi:MAG: transglycosylase SLT domain-containing protein [Bacteroidetes bacterium]|nr:transglycosylase SLT domain-containing protein [Bacteroidota bacterium]